MSIRLVQRIRRGWGLRGIWGGAGGFYLSDSESVWRRGGRAVAVCGIIGYRSLKRANPRANCKLALYGFGSSAHVVIQIALKRGYEVYVATRGKSHRQLAKELGATWVGESAGEMPEMVDSAIIFAPA